MITRNRLNPGDYVVPIPLGIPLVLEYNSRGLINRMNLWADDDNEFETASIKLDSSVVNTLKHSSNIPNHISLKGGTTYVYGVITIPNPIKLSGKIPSDILASMYIDAGSMKELNFMAFSMKSYAAKFAGASPIRKWLSINHFKLLPGFILPVYKAPYTDLSQIDELTLKDNDVDVYMAYVKFDSTSENIISAELRQSIVSAKPDVYVNENGVFRANVRTETDLIDISYQDMCKFGISEGTCLILRGESTVIHSSSPSIKSPDIVCPICGKVVPVNRLTRCSDAHCLSRLYNDLNHMLTTLKLPMIEYAKYIELIKSHQIIVLSDILDTSEYSGIEVSASLDTLLSAVICPKYVPDRRAIYQLVSQCHNSVESIMYYANHPNDIHRDLNMGNVNYNQLVMWLEEPENVSELHAMLYNTHIKIVETDKYFRTDPIFRNTTICITGDFESGSHSDIKGILSSYSARVVENVDSDMKYVVVGDSRCNVDSRIISAARSANIPVVEEHEFFKLFGIDKDIQNNLL